jgi:ribonuclease J
VATLTFHGGVGEIGGNKVLLEHEGSRVFLDFGMSFGRKGAFYEEFLQPRTNNGLRDLMELGIAPKIDGIYRGDLLRIEGIDEVVRETGCPDSDLWTSPVRSYEDFERENGSPFIQAVLISHGHLDHFQYVSFLDERIPIYCSDITRTVIETAEALGQGGFEYEFTVAKKRSLSAMGPRAYFPGARTVTTEPVSRAYRVLPDRMTIGPFEVRSFPVDHSVPGAVAFAIAAPDGKTIVYTGDLRFHGTRSDLTERFRDALRESRPDALVVEGTRVKETSPDSESGVEEKCLELVSRTRGLAMVGFAWKDVTRYQTMKRVAERTGRTLVISPKLAFLLNRLKDRGELDITPAADEEAVRVYIERKGGMLYSKADYVNSKYDIGYSAEWDKKDPDSIDVEHLEHGVRAYQIGEAPSKYLVHLDYYDFNELLDLKPPPGSTYIRASSEPFNDEMRLDEARLKRWLEHFDINAPAHEPFYVHASGHASGSEIAQLIRDISPKIVFPIHTEHPDAFRDIAPEGTQVVIPRTGEQYKV